MGGGHTTAGPPEQTPSRQVSPVVQPLASLQLEPVRSVQVPSAVAPSAVVHASQAPALHEVSQQTPSAQDPEAQSAPAKQGAPRACGWSTTASALRGAKILSEA